MTNVIISEKLFRQITKDDFVSVRFKRSYRDRKESIARRKKTVLQALIIILSFQILYSVFFTTIKIGNSSMEPSIKKNSVLIYSPVVYGYQLFLINKRLPQIQSPERGDLILLSPPYYEESNNAFSNFSKFIQFLTLGKINLQKLNPDRWDSGALIKRIIAVPGDTVKMRDFSVSIKPAGSDYFLSEFEVIENEYDISIGELPESWPENMPFSGNMSAVTLEDGQYFVLGDNRTLSSDSTSWGLLDRDRIIAKIIMTYWPLKEIQLY